MYNVKETQDICQTNSKERLKTVNDTTYVIRGL